MKKLLIIVAMVLIAISASAQTSLLKVSYEGGVEPNWWPEGKNPLIVEPTSEGLALTNPRPVDWERIWWSEMALTDDCLTLQKNHHYVVRLTVKVPHFLHSSGRDGGSYTVRLGSWEKWYQYVVTVSGGDDYQVIDVEFPDFPREVDGNGHVIIKTVGVVGITIVKEVEVFEEPIPESPVVDGMKLLSKKNWEGVDVNFYWDYMESVNDCDVEGTDEGLAITNPTLKGEIWTPQVTVANEFDLERNHNYIVRLTLKVPSDGIYQVRMGNWDASFLAEVLLAGSDDWQVIDVQFPDFGGDIKSEMVDSLFENAFVILGCGWVVGTTVVKEVEVYEVLGSSARGNTTGIKAAKASKAGDTIYNLAGQRVDASYKGVVIQNGKKRMVR